MFRQAINNYYKKLDQYKRFGGTRNESSIKRAFANLLEEYCLAKNLILIDELPVKTHGSASLRNAKRPDGTINNAMQIAYGHYESKDTKDDLDKEIEKKIEIGYPTFNILFENTEEIVLIQKGEEVLRGEMQNADFLHRILTAFVEYEHDHIKQFDKAVEKFKEDIPDIIEALRKMIAKQSEINPDFRVQREKFWNICKTSINPQISEFDIREMLIQHILTAEIFDTVFGDSHFHRENNIARELEIVINTFFTGAIRRDTLASVDNYYKTIKKEAASIDNHHNKQKFLKIVYENFYKAYNPKGADLLGVVYTPNEIVKFMVESTDYLLGKYFSKSFRDKNVQILDPATGTGTFITEIIEYIPPKYLENKYKNEIHCNELAILPYYIANLNIEFTYQQKMNKYEPFENIVFVDTLDNLGFSYEGKQGQMFDISTENMKRIEKQNKEKISVVIGNPPYNANQMNENDNNKNRTYPIIDKQIKDTYVKNSTAQKSKVYDMYARFYRWATNRINENGIIAFITNRSFIESRTFDGFRKSVENEFDYIYLVDLNGDIRSRKEQAGGNVFGIMTGVTIAFFIKKEEFDLKNNKIKKDKARIYYTSIFKEGKAKEKLNFLNSTNFKQIPFESIVPDKKNNWLDIANNDFDKLLQIISKNNKEKSLFTLYSNGISTNRDDWVYDFDKKNLEAKSKFFINEYNSELKRWIKFKKDTNYTDIKAESNPILDNFLHERNIIKWSSRLKRDKLRKEKFGTFEKGNAIKWSKMIKRDKLRKGKAGIFDKTDIIECNYRPFTKKILYYGYTVIDIKGKFENIFPAKNTENKIITIDNSGKLFHILSSNKVVDLHFTGDSVCFPLYRFDKSGKRIDNISEWGLKQFTEHYKNEKITKEDIFYYTYAVLHNPKYREKYKLNLKREFPRLPFYKDFFKWVTWGEKLMDLHINYENMKPYKLQIVENEKLKENPKTKLKRDKINNNIILDENTTIKGIPEQAFEYKLGNRSAIDWILNQYKEKEYSKNVLKKYPNKQILNDKFNNYKFSDYKTPAVLILTVSMLKSG